MIGRHASTLALQLGTTPGPLILTLLPHAIPELVALFLPLAAWIIASRSDDWHDLLAATAVTVAIAVPMLLPPARSRSGSPRQQLQHQPPLRQA